MSKSEASKGLHDRLHAQKYTRRKATRKAGTGDLKIAWGVFPALSHLPCPPGLPSGYSVSNTYVSIFFSLQKIDLPIIDFLENKSQL